MVRCNAVDGYPCKCELTNPCVVYLIETILSNMLKLLLDTISNEEREELRAMTRIPNAKTYLKLYIKELDNHRNMTSDVILDMISDDVILDNI